MRIVANTFGEAWYQLLDVLVHQSRMHAGASPRGLATAEQIGVQLQVVSGLSNILVSPARNPSYRFMVAEMAWILSGQEDVASISKYNKNIVDFSDDGNKFYGAYGPKFYAQMFYLAKKLAEDIITRQAVATIWIQNPAPTKDVPCTISFQLLCRDGKMNSIVTMRSSDLWLGLPYDYYNFSTITSLYAAAFNMKVGSVYFNLGSSHLYLKDLDKAKEALRIQAISLQSKQIELPQNGSPMSRIAYFTEELQHNFINEAIGDLPSDFWVLPVLHTKSNMEALDVLTSLNR